MKAPNTISPEKEADQVPREFGIDALRREQRGLNAPFRLRLSAPESGEILNCTVVLRHLPGKRLVCMASRPNGETMVVKLFLAPRQAGRHHKRERKGISILEKAGIPTPTLLPPMTLADGRTPLVATAAIEGARSLAAWWPEWNTRQRQSHLLACVRLIARLHAAGCIQEDIHPGNFLISGADVFMLDGNAVRTLGNPSSKDERRYLVNLAAFLVQFDPATDHWTHAALRAYEHQRGWRAQTERFPTLKRLMRRCRHKRLRKRAAKVTRPCTDIMAQRSWYRYMACDRAWYTAAMQPLLEDPDRFIEKGHNLKDGNSATVARIRYRDQTLVIKRYNIKNLWHRLRRCLRPSRGRMAWRNAHMLGLVGIDTPAPRALIEERWGPFRARAFLICDHQPGMKLADYWQHDWHTDDTRMDALAPLTTLVMHLDAAQISHGDMKATNLIVDAGRIVLTDLDGLRIYRRTPGFRRHHRKDCERLLRNWPRHSNIARTLRRALGDIRMAE